MLFKKNILIFFLIIIFYLELHVGINITNKCGGAPSTLNNYCPSPGSSPSTASENSVKPVINLTPTADAIIKGFEKSPREIIKALLPNSDKNYFSNFTGIKEVGKDFFDESKKNDE